MKYYFIIGSILYMSLAITAFILSNNRKADEFLAPISYFYMAVILESTIFSIGLGFRIRDINIQKLLIQKDLVNAQEKLSQELQIRLKNQEEQNKLLQQLTDQQKLETEIAQLSTKVLRSQMNSHFIFNVLNSIKLFILENDTQNANLYLSKFSKFIRKILDGSFNEVISLEDELETMDLYLTIEKMRFDNRFTYTISPLDSQTKFIKIPALITQPFIENSLKHGFINATNEALLEIIISRKEQDTIIIIRDNGVGRLHPKEMNDNQKSYGLQIVKERIELFNKNYNKNLSFEIKDLKQGTEIIIYLN